MAATQFVITTFQARSDRGLCRWTVRRARNCVDLRDAGAAFVGLRDVTIAETRRDEVAEAVDFPRRVFVVEGPAGAAFSLVWLSSGVCSSAAALWGEAMSLPPSFLLSSAGVSIPPKSDLKLVNSVPTRRLTPVFSRRLAPNGDTMYRIESRGSIQAAVNSADDSNNNRRSTKKAKLVNEKLLAKLHARGESLEERKERRAQKRAAKIQARFGYTAEENPFNDPNNVTGDISITSLAATSGLVVFIGGVLLPDSLQPCDYINGYDVPDGDDNVEWDNVDKPVVRLSKECFDLLLMMLVRDPEKRYTIRQVSQHPWFNDV